MSVEELAAAGKAVDGGAPGAGRSGGFKWLGARRVCRRCHHGECPAGTDAEPEPLIEGYCAGVGGDDAQERALVAMMNAVRERADKSRTKAMTAMG